MKPSNLLQVCGLQLRQTADRLLPLQLRNALYTTKHCAGLWSAAPIPVTLLSGQFWGTNEESTVLTAGPLASLAYWTDSLFEGDPKQESLGAKRMPGLRKFIARHRSAADLTLARVDDYSAKLWRGDGYLPSPEWVGVSLQVPADESAMRMASRSARDDIRLLRRHDLEIGFSKDDDDLVDFYNNMYRPYTLAKYGPTVFTPPMNWFRRHFRSGGLVWVVKDGIRISGMLVGHENNVLDCIVLGVRDGDLGLVKKGALAGLYVGVIQHAMGLGAKRIDLRGCRPALTDGVLRFKLKWKGELYRKRENVFHQVLIYWPRANNRVRSFLSDFAPIFLDGDRMMAASAVSADADQDDFGKLEHLVPYRGLDTLGVITPGRPPRRAALHPSTVILPGTASSGDVLAGMDCPPGSRQP